MISVYLMCIWQKAWGRSIFCFSCKLCKFPWYFQKPHNMRKLCKQIQEGPTGARLFPQPVPSQICVCLSLQDQFPWLLPPTVVSIPFNPIQPGGTVCPLYQNPTNSSNGLEFVISASWIFFLVNFHSENLVQTISQWVMLP